MPGSRETHLQWQLYRLDGKSTGQAAYYLTKGCPSTGQGVRSCSAPKTLKEWVGGCLAQFYLVCIVVGLVVEQWRGTDGQIILQRLAQQ